MHVLSDLWYGNIAPHERTILPNSEYKRLLHALGALGEQIRETASPEQKALMDKYEDIYSTIIAQNEEDAFTIGFRLGAKMMLDILDDHCSV